MNDKSIFWQENLVTNDDRSRLMGQKGLVVWLTGLSGSGKSTIAIHTERLLYEKGIMTCLLDGDNLRHGINSDLGFSIEDRFENIRRAAEMAKILCDAGIVVLACFISPLIKMREMARDIIGSERFIEVYVEADIETCRERDPKGLYKKGIDGFTGVTGVYEEPERADVVINTNVPFNEDSIYALYDRIMKSWSKVGHGVRI